MNHNVMKVTVLPYEDFVGDVKPANEFQISFRGPGAFGMTHEMAEAALVSALDIRRIQIMITYKFERPGVYYVELSPDVGRVD